MAAVLSTTSATPQPPRFDPADFTHPARINNKWLPLVPGTQFTLDGQLVSDTGELVPHRVVLTVTDLTKVIGGVRTVVLWDRDFNAGQLAEAELAFEAQDNTGNVWNIGEYPEEYENGMFTGAPSTWINGVAGAKGGYGMLAAPAVGTPVYVQGSVPAIKFLDYAQVSKTGQQVCVRLGCYRDVLVVDEWSPLDPTSGHQLKYYAPGVGNIRIGAVGGEQQEFLEVTKIVHLSRNELAAARAAALALDKHAYEVSKVYRGTAPAG
ncbi:MAG TPA: hypothetical protein VLJ59_20595 [Mycobacteriales bacterium]|nr:hypothetical protein [Mycobacteriales bacterium]